LAAISDPEERWAAIKDPPVDERTGKRRWTPETTRKRVGYHGPGPETAQEKVEAVHDLVVDEQVAAQVVTDLLRRPAVAFKAMTDDTATHQVNHAQWSSPPSRVRPPSSSSKAPRSRSSRPCAIVWADLAYTGTLAAWAKSFLHVTIKTVSRPKGAKGFVILPSRWVVERSLCATRRSVCIPGSTGRNSEGGSWANDLPGSER
jgi:transposase